MATKKKSQVKPEPKVLKPKVELSAEAVMGHLDEYLESSNPVISAMAGILAEQETRQYEEMIGENIKSIKGRCQSIIDQVDIEINGLNELKGILKTFLDSKAIFTDIKKLASGIDEKCFNGLADEIEADSGALLELLRRATDL